MTTTLDVDSVIERLLSVRGQQNNRTVQLAEGEIRALCAAARCVREDAKMRGGDRARIYANDGDRRGFLVTRGARGSREGVVDGVKICLADGAFVMRRRAIAWARGGSGGGWRDSREAIRDGLMCSSVNDARARVLEGVREERMGDVSSQNAESTTRWRTRD